MTRNEHPPKRQFVQSVERTEMPLEAIAAGNPAGETVAGLAETCGLQRAKAWRMLSTLESRGFLQSCGSTHRYQLGSAIVRLFSSAGMLGFPLYARGLEHVRHEGCAVCHGELQDNRDGVSAPALDDRGHPFAVVSVWGPRSRMPDARLTEFGELAQQAAAAMIQRASPHHTGAKRNLQPVLEVSS